MTQSRKARRADRNKPTAKKSLSTMSAHELNMLHTNAAVKTHERIKKMERRSLWIVILLIIANWFLGAIYLSQ